MKTRIIFKIANLIFIVALVTSAVFIVGRQIKKTNNSLNELNNKLLVLDQKNDELAKRIEEVSLQKSIVKEEVVRREVVREKSQEELLTAAVAKVSPAVVSIVISKDVPLLEIVYENPFGNDPFFQDFGFRIPVYRQKGTERKDVGAGTGFIIRSNGYIITNRHVVEDIAATYTVLLSNGSQEAAQVVWRDPNNDVAILKITGSKYTTIDLGNSAILALGQSVFAIGNALGQYNNSVSVGIVSGLNRNIEAAGSNGLVEKLSGVIQTDAAINPGNSGGPLVDLGGQAIGINVATVVGSSNISFSIPINIVKNIINSVLK